jgi:GntR family transcriptional repressor for pyruvate dehydrogenase complex
LREAIKALEQMGLVKTRQGDGTRVLDFMQTAGVELVSHLVLPVDGKPDLNVLADVLEFRRLFGREVARLSAERATPSDFARLEEIADRAGAASATPEEVLTLDFEFYVALTNASRNRVLQLLINTIRSAVVNYANFFVNFNPPPAVVRKHHRDLLKALQSRESERAAQVADTYLRRGADQMLAILKPAS